MRSETIREPTQAAEVKNIKVVTLNAETKFEKIVHDGLPVVLKGLNIGPCVDRWTLNYLSKQLGGDRKVRMSPSKDGRTL